MKLEAGTLGWNEWIDEHPADAPHPGCDCDTCYDARCEQERSKADENQQAKEYILFFLRDIHAVLGMNLRHDTGDMSDIVIHRTSYAWNKLGELIAAFEEEHS
jgi:hypothetical protein